MKSTKKVTCRPCKEQNNWEVETPGGKVLPNHFATKAEAVRVGKQYAMEAGAELEVVNKKQSSNVSKVQRTQKQTRKASRK